MEGVIKSIRHFSIRATRSFADTSAMPGDGDKRTPCYMVVINQGQTQVSGSRVKVNHFANHQPGMVAILEQFKHLSMRVFISGQKKFAEEVLRLCISMKIEVAGVCCPVADQYIRKLAVLHNIPVTPAGMLNADNFPGGVDLGITAHSLDYIGKRLRYKPRVGWIGYHPSLLPRHRGRSAIEWAIRFGDIVTGGTIYWLNSGIDRGDIAYQDWCWIDPRSRLQPPAKAAQRLWRSTLMPMGIRLFKRALIDIKSGVIRRKKQDVVLSTFEPDANIKDVFKPDLLMLPEGNA